MPISLSCYSPAQLKWALSCRLRGGTPRRRGPAPTTIRSDLSEVFFKRAILGLFFVYLGLFKQTTQILQQINVKNVHPVSGAGIRTPELIMSRLL